MQICQTKFIFSLNPLKLMEVHVGQVTHQTYNALFLSKVLNFPFSFNSVPQNCFSTKTFEKELNHQKNLMIR